MSIIRRFFKRLICPLAFFAVTLTVFAGTVSGAENGLNSVLEAIANQSASWTAGTTSVSRLSPEARKGLMGALLPLVTEEEEQAVEHSRSILAASGAPSALDWRDYSGQNYVTPVRDQGHCGSCWAFAAAAALESQVLMDHNMPGANVDLSEQVLLSCSSAGSCGGGYIDKAANFLKDAGLPLETCLPYDTAQQVCQVCSDWKKEAYAISGWRWVATTKPSVDGLKNALYTYGPLVTMMEVYEDFYYYKDGVYKGVSQQHEATHAVLIVGYDDEGQFFIAKNSWGKDWGEEGFFKIAYGELTSNVKFGQYTMAYDSSKPASTPCAYTISPANRTATQRGGKATVGVATDKSCTWNAASNAEWLSVAAGVTGVGKNKVSVSVEPNNDVSVRTGTVTIAGQIFTVTQAGKPCKMTALAPTNLSFSRDGGAGTFSVSVEPQGCSWSASVTSQDPSWVTISEGTATGNGAVIFAVSANPSSKARTGKITVVLDQDPKKKKVFTVKQTK